MHGIYNRQDSSRGNMRQFVSDVIVNRKKVHGAQCIVHSKNAGKKYKMHNAISKVVLSCTASRKETPEDSILDRASYLSGAGIPL